MADRATDDEAPGREAGPSSRARGDDGRRSEPSVRPVWWPAAPRPTWRDLLAGVSVALVLVPQSLAYAVLAGMPAATGLAVAAVSTIAAAPFVSSPYLQTGPVAITALLAFGGLSGLAEPGSSEYVALAALLALMVGALRLLIGVLRAGDLAYLMSQPVLAGFTPAAALVIAIGQLPDLVGVEADGRGPTTVVPALLDLSSWDATTLALGTLGVALMLGGQRLHRLFPAVLVTVVAGLVVAGAVGFGGEVVGSIPTSLPVLDLALPIGRTAELLVPALVIALVGFAEPAAIARTYASRARERWDADREFVSQGTANVAAGLFGGFPVGGSFSRTAVAHEAGARTAWSGAITGLVVLAATPFAGVFAELPSAVLAAVIFASVLGLVRVREVLRLRSWSRQQFLIATTTFGLTLLLAPRIQFAILVGVALAIAAHLRRELLLGAGHEVDGTTLHVRPHGVLYFGSAHHLESQVLDLLSSERGVARVAFHLDRLGRIDVTGALELRGLVDRLRDAGLEVDVRDLTVTGRKIVERVFDFDDVDLGRGDLRAPETAVPATGAAAQDVRPERRRGERRSSDRRRHGGDAQADGADRDGTDVDDGEPHGHAQA